jgi:hypothetical protein
VPGAGRRQHPGRDRVVAPAGLHIGLGIIDAHVAGRVDDQPRPFAIQHGLHGERPRGIELRARRGDGRQAAHLAQPHEGAAQFRR